MTLTPSSDLISIDLFAGAGGLSEGLEEAGFHTLFASEIVPQYAETYARNHPSAKVCVEDIRKTDPERVRRELGLEKGQLDLVAGGPPCQGFSINAPVRSNEDPRNHLFREYLRYVDAFQPRAILIENVPGLVSFEHGGTLHAILDALADLGYGADVHILGALTTVCHRCVGVLSFLAFVARLYRNPLGLNPLVMLLCERTSLPLLMGDKLLSSLAPKQMRHSLRFVKPLEICLHYRTVNAAKRSKNTR